MKRIIGEIIDRKFEKIGFTKVQDDEYAVEYNRYETKHKFLHCLRIVSKTSGRHIVQSYDPDLIDAKKIGCTAVGLTSYEMMLCVLKMWSKGWNSK